MSDARSGDRTDERKNAGMDGRSNERTGDRTGGSDGRKNARSGATHQTIGRTVRRAVERTLERSDDRIRSDDRTDRLDELSSRVPSPDTNVHIKEICTQIRCSDGLRPRTIYRRARHQEKHGCSQKQSACETKSEGEDQGWQ